MTRETGIGEWRTVARAGDLALADARLTRCRTAIGRELLAVDILSRAETVRRWRTAATAPLPLPRHCRATQDPH